MAFYHYGVWLLWSAIVLSGSVLVESSSTQEGKQIRSPETVTKRISFPSFKPDPKLVHQVKLLGSAVFSDGEGAIRIPDESHASDLRHQAGRAIYSFPIRLLDPASRTPASFETSFSFQFSNHTSSADLTNELGNNTGGSGLTFVIVPDEFTVGRPGAWLAMLNDACEENYKAFAVEFDARENPEFGDPNDNHIGFNLGSIISTTTVNASDFGISLKDGLVHQAWISYDGPNRRIEVRLDSHPVYSGSLDLFPFLNEYMFVGFSASTGNMTQIHSIYSWNFTSTSQASLRVPSAETCESKIIHNYDREGVLNSESRSPSKPVPPDSLLIFIAVMGFAIAAVAVIFQIRRRKRDRAKVSAFPEKKQRPRPPNKPRRYSISEISSATRGFNEYEILGSDSRGIYYRGKLLNGSQVAIKRYSTQFLSSQASLERRRLVKEISTMSKIRHPNLVPIRGWCQSNREVMVIFEFYSNGSLDKWLFGVGVLPWTRRLKVVKDIADGLSFLHSKQLAHKNMKTSSVFLDISFRAVLGDFGFVLSSTESRRFEAAVSQQVDVFEFGIFILEVVSGRGRMDPEVNPDEKDLVDFAWRMHETNEKGRVVDRRMGSVVNLEQAIKVLDIGLLCTLNENKGRPNMEEVVEYLSLDNPIPQLPPSRPVAFCPYNSTSSLCSSYSCTPFK